VLVTNFMVDSTEGEALSCSKRQWRTGIISVMGCNFYMGKSMQYTGMGDRQAFGGFGLADGYCSVLVGGGWFVLPLISWLYLKHVLFIFSLDVTYTNI
jgi:hypothetical protein